MVQRIQLVDKKIQEIPSNQTVFIEDDYSITILRDNDKFTLGSDQWLCATIHGKLTVNKKQWKSIMKLSELIEHMQTLMAEHGDHEVWLEDNYGEPVPYCAEWFRFQTELYGDAPANVYTI